MSRLCTICSHPQRDAINAALLVHDGGYRNIGKRFGVGYQAVYQHEHNHLAYSLSLAKELVMILSADNLPEAVGKWHERMEQQYRKADDADNIFGAVAVARAALAAIDSFAKLGALSDLEKRLRAIEEGITGDGQDA